MLKRIGPWREEGKRGKKIGESKKERERGNRSKNRSRKRNCWKEKVHEERGTEEKKEKCKKI